MELKNKLASTKCTAAKKADRDANTIKSLQELVNLLHKEIDKVGEAWERACYLQGEYKKDVEKMKKKLLQVEQLWAKFEHDLTKQIIEVGKLKNELNRAWIKIDEVGSSAVEAERRIDDLRKDIRELSVAKSELMQRVIKLTKDAEVISKRAIKMFKASKYFKDGMNESALVMFLQGFDECQKQLRLLHPDLNLSKLRREFSDKD